jgi:putative addiction module component (TIGR02574 family)
MSIETILDAVRALPPEERLRIADAIWSEVEDEDFTEDQKAEIDRRIANFDATGKTASWEAVLAAARARWGR